MESRASPDGSPVPVAGRTAGQPVGSFLAISLRVAAGKMPTEYGLPVLVIPIFPQDHSPEVKPPSYLGEPK
jgi:hypothetical protein